MRIIVFQELLFDVDQTIVERVLVDTWNLTIPDWIIGEVGGTWLRT